MQSEVALSEIEECIVNADLSGVEGNLRLLLKSDSEIEVSQKIANLLYKFYTPYKSGYLAKVLEIVIRTNPNLAILNHPENFLFKAAVLTGSEEMYECYIEEAVIPFLSLVVAEEHEMHYIELLDIAQRLSDHFFKLYPACKMGLDFSGSFSASDGYENVVSMHLEDYETMKDVVAKYNIIIGRRDIIKDLSSRAGLEF